MKKDSKREELTLFLSFYRHGHLSRGIARVKVHNGQSRFLKSKERVRVRTRLVNAKGIGKIKRIASLVIREPANLSDIIGAVEKAVGDEAGKLIAAQLTLPREKNETWITPWAEQFLGAFQEWQQTHEQLTNMKCDADKPSQIRFYERNERIARGNLLIDFGIDEATAELIKVEIENFQKGFALEL